MASATWIACPSKLKTPPTNWNGRVNKAQPLWVRQNNSTITRSGLN